MDVGQDSVSPVCDDYDQHGIFAVTGQIRSVTFDLTGGHEPTGMERLEMATKMD
jgi:hypothetical protein